MLTSELPGSENTCLTWQGGDFGDVIRIWREGDYLGEPNVIFRVLIRGRQLGASSIRGIHRVSDVLCRLEKGP
jgi:hypothetical protein